MSPFLFFSIPQLICHFAVSGADMEIEFEMQDKNGVNPVKRRRHRIGQKKKRMDTSWSSQQKKLGTHIAYQNIPLSHNGLKIPLPGSASWCRWGLEPGGL